MAVTDSPGTLADADTADQMPGLIQLHIGMPTICGRPTAGLEAMTGLGSTKFLRAWAASAAGVGSATGGGGGAGSHTIVVVVVAMFVPGLIPSGQVIAYQAPFCPVCASSPSPGCGVKVGS